MMSQFKSTKSRVGAWAGRRGRLLKRQALGLALTGVFSLGLAGWAQGAEHMHKNAYQTDRAFSPGVVTEGGKTVWLAGSSALTDAQGRDIAYQFDAQLKRVWEQIDETLARQGGSLKDVVTITVYLLDPRLGDKVVASRKALWPDGRYPGSALITVSNFAKPGILVEIQAVAVVGDRRAEVAP
jgi:2-iminobutanoate/2-iminopropanoate deaminase